MSYKTASRNQQRWTTNNDKFTKERLKPTTFECHIDFSRSLYFAIDFITSVIAICEHCKTKIELSPEELRKSFDLDTKFHIVFSILKKETLCKACKKTGHGVFICKKKMSKDKAKSIIEKQNKELLKAEQKKNAKLLYEKIKRDSDAIKIKPTTKADKFENKLFSDAILQKITTKIK